MITGNMEVYFLAEFLHVRNIDPPIFFNIFKRIKFR